MARMTLVGAWLSIFRRKPINKMYVIIFFFFFQIWSALMVRLVARYVTLQGSETIGRMLMEANRWKYPMITINAAIYSVVYDGTKDHDGLLDCQLLTIIYHSSMCVLGVTLFTNQLLTILGIFMHAYCLVWYFASQLISHQCIVQVKANFIKPRRSFNSRVIN
jgi:hypothetical protein